DLVEDRVYNVLDIPLIEMRVVLGDTLNEFGFNHRDWDPGTLRRCISVNMPCSVKTLNQAWAARNRCQMARSGRVTILAMRDRGAETGLRPLNWRPRSAIMPACHRSSTAPRLA